MNKEILINDFATRSFRETADYDYIAARMAYRTQLVPQFLWSSLQAIEKYLKCILLLNRIEAGSIRHDLSTALTLIDKHAPFQLRIQEPSRKFIKHLDTYGRFRYLETPFHVMGMEIMQLDMAVWDIRRYCQVLNYEFKQPHGEKLQMLKIKLGEIEASDAKSPHLFSIFGGALEKIIANKEHPAREPLLWQNLFFGQHVRKRVRLRQYMHATNPPLSLHPEILDDVLRYIFLPKGVIKFYRDELENKKAKELSK